MLLTKERYNQLEQEKERLIKEYKNLKEERSRLSGESSGYDETRFVVINVNEEMRRLLCEIDRIDAILQNAEIVTPKEHLDDIVHLGDTVTIEFDDEDRLTFKLVTSVTNLEEIGETVSLDSPIGKAVYLKQLGDKSSCEVNKKKFNFTIVELENVHEDKIEQQLES